MAASAVEAPDVYLRRHPEVEHRDVRVVPLGDPPLGDVEQSPRFLGAHADRLRQRQLPLADHLHDHGHGGLHAGYPRRGGPELLLLLGGGVRSVIRADHVESPCQEPPPEPVADVRGPDRGVDLVLRPGEPVDVEGQVMHGDLGGETGRLRHSGALDRGDMADVDRRSLEIGCETRYRVCLGGGRTVAQMVPAAALLPLRYEVVVLRMDRHPPPGGEDIPHSGDQLLVVIEQDVARGGTHEQLESDDQGSEHAGVHPGRHGREEAVIGHRLPADGGLLLVERLDIGHGGLRVRHVVDAGHPRMYRRHRPGAEVLLRGHPGIAEMHVRIDESRDHYPAGPQVDPPLPSGDVAPGGDDAPVLRYPDLGVPELPVDQRPSFQYGVDVGHPDPSTGPPGDVSVQTSPLNAHTLTPG